jgi:hypothetical protein
MQDGQADVLIIEVRTVGFDRTAKEEGEGRSNQKPLHRASSLSLRARGPLLLDQHHAWR